MSEPFIGEIRMFAGNFAPRGWANCDGQLLQVSQNDALFSLVGTVYGGDGRTTFGIPDLRGRVPIHSGNGSAGPDLTSHPLGQKSGEENHILTATELPPHTHTPVAASAATANQTSPTGNVVASPDKNLYRDAGSGVDANFNAAMIANNTGSNPSIPLMAPFLTVRFIIALSGIYPSRT